MNVKSMKALEELGRVRLSPSFFFRDFLYSEIANFYGVPNIPEDPDTAVEAARGLCENLLEPMSERLGKISIRSAYRSPSLNEAGNARGLNCGSNEYNRARHIYDWRDENGDLGATATVVVNAYVDHYEATREWTPLAWYIHDHFPYSEMFFFPKLAAFILTWSETPKRIIRSYIGEFRGRYLTKPGMENHSGDHASEYDLPLFKSGKA